MSDIPTSMAVPAFRGEKLIEWVEKPVPRPAPGQLLIRASANALCGTDRLQLRVGSPVTPGHEATGTVVSVGDGATVPVGARGVLYLMGFCSACRSCAGGFTNQCLDKTADIGFERDGGYGPYVIVEERRFLRISDDVDLTLATLLLDVMGTSGHAIARARLVRQDVERVFIAGAGPIGLGLVAMCRLLLGHQVQVICSDVSSYRLALAEQLGAIPVNVSDAPLADRLAAIHDRVRHRVRRIRTRRGASRCTRCAWKARRSGLRRTRSGSLDQGVAGFDCKRTRDSWKRVLPTSRVFGEHAALERESGLPRANYHAPISCDGH